MSTEKKSNPVIMWIGIILATLIAFFLIRGLIRNHPSAVTGKYPISGECKITISNPGKIYYDPQKTTVMFHHEGKNRHEGDLKLVCEQDPNKSFVCSQKPEETTSDHAEELEKLQKGNYLAYPVGTDELDLNWHQ